MVGCFVTGLFGRGADFSQIRVALEKGIMTAEFFSVLLGGSAFKQIKSFQELRIFPFSFKKIFRPWS